MAEDLISEYVDRTGFSGDTKFILDELNKIWAAFEKLKEVKFSLDKSSGLGQVIPLAKEAATQIKLVVSSQAELDKEIIRGKVEQQAYNAAIKDQIKLEQAAEGSINQKRVQLKQLQQQYDSLAESQRNTDDGKKLLKQVQDLDTELKDLEGTTGRFQRNVGNYQQSAKIIVDAFERAKVKLEQVNRTMGQSSPEAAAARKEFETLDRITQQPQFLNISAKVGDANAELKFFTKSLIELERNGQGGSQAANELRTQLARLTDEIADTRQEVKALSSDTRNFDLFAGSVNFAADAFQTYAGAAALAGASEKDAAEATKTLVAIQSVANGVKGIANELTTRGTAANKAYAFVQGQVAIATNASATATQRWGAIFKLTVFGLIATAIGFLISQFSKMKSGTEDLIDTQESLNNVAKQTAETFATEKVALDVLIAEYTRSNTTQERRKEIFDELQSKYPAYFANLSTEKSSVDEITAAYEKLSRAMLLKARVAAATSELAKQEARVIAIALKFGIDDLDAIEKFAIDFLENAPSGDLNNIFKAHIQQFLNTRAILNSIIAKSQKELDELGGDPTKGGKTETPRVKASKEEAKQIEAIENKLLKDLLAIQIAMRENAEDFVDQLASARTEEFEKRLDQIQKAFQKENSLNETSRDQQLLDNQKAFDAGRITQEEFNKRKVEIEKNYQRTTLEIQLDFYDAQLGLLKAFGEDTVAAEAAIAAARLKLAELGSGATTDTGTGKTKEEKTLEDLAKIKATYEDVTSVILGLSNALNQRQLNNIQDQMDSIDRLKSLEIERINASTDSEEKKAARIAILEARTDAQKQQLELRKRQVQERQAKFEKAAIIGKIILDTASAIVEALPNLALAVVAGALGAAQLAVAIATPIPRYKHGKNVNDLYEGPAIVDDGGRPEAIIRADGSVEIGGNTPRLTHLGKKDIVMPDAMKWVDHLISKSLQPPAYNTKADDGTIDAVKTIGKNIVQAINNKTENYFYTEGPLKKRISKNGDSWTEYLNKNLQS